ncbi:MAG: CZB domain-containing protein [Deltaproteobacteria bacterium]|nr:CZB domain-containing protein [Deltaproteobacteria bacterium]
MTELVFICRDTEYALDISKIQEIVPSRALEPVQSSCPWVKGATKIRNKFFYVFDFRKILGLPILLEERQTLVETLNQREKDHIDWLEALYKSITEKVEFTKAKDPTKCAFGKWYYSYKAPDSTIRRLLDQFEDPHNRIHSLAEKLLNLAEHDQKKAVEILEDEKRFTLAKMLKLFAELKQILITNIRSLLIVFGPVFESSVVLEVDAVDNLRHLEKENLEMRPIKTDKEIIDKVWVNEKTTIYGINFKNLFEMLYKVQYPATESFLNPGF